LHKLKESRVNNAGLILVLEMMVEVRAMMGAAAPHINVAGRPRMCRAWREDNPSIVCSRCQTVGHWPGECRNTPVCAFCFGSHLTNVHKCPVLSCGKVGTACPHVNRQCILCRSNEDFTSHRECAAVRGSSSSPVLLGPATPVVADHTSVVGMIDHSRGRLRRQAAGRPGTPLAPHLVDNAFPVMVLRRFCSNLRSIRIVLVMVVGLLFQLLTRVKVLRVLRRLRLMCHGLAERDFYQSGNMLLNICTIKVGASVGNRAVVCDVFSPVDVFFIVDPPVDGLGGFVDGDVGGFTCLSGTVRSDVHVSVRSSFVGLFDVVWVDARGVVVSVVSDGIARRIGGVYLRLGLKVASVDEFLTPYKDCDILLGDMNAWNDRWGHVADVCSDNSQGRAVSRVLADMDFMVPSTATHDAVSIIDLCGFRWRPHRYRISHRAGLPHAGQIVKICVDIDILPDPKPAYKRARWDLVEQALCDIPPSSEDIWQSARAVVDSLP